MLKILAYSDLHLEFGNGWKPPASLVGDLLVLAGDIISFNDPTPLSCFLEIWGNRPVLYVAGNHEYYECDSMEAALESFQKWLVSYPNVHFLQDEAVTIDGVHFFGGTMWTNLTSAEHSSILEAQSIINDFRLIFTDKDKPFTVSDSQKLHHQFVEKLTKWLKTPLGGPRVVVTHHAPLLHHISRYAKSVLMPAYISLDMISLIEQHQPDLWIYGHTHQCDDQTLGKSRIISNQLGYRNGLGGFQCLDFDDLGKGFDLITK